MNIKSRSKKIKNIVITPFEKFLKIESLSGLLLFGATIIALIWANSAYGNLYQELWNYNLEFKIQDFNLSKPLILWINDGLMAIFFFLIGLEIKREILVGEINTLKKASLPIFAAFGGIIIPVTLFFVLNQNPETAKGWGIPMATDIAFSLAILQLLGKRIPLSLKIFLTAFAIVDDLGAVFAIALFYSATIEWTLIGYTLLPFAALLFLSYKGVFNKFIVFILSCIIWLLFLKSGIHPTVAGVLIAFTIPIRQKINFVTYSKKLKLISENICRTEDTQNTILSKKQIYLIDDLQDWTEKVQSPLQHLEHSIHSWVAFLIIPVFALANAGIMFGGTENIDYAISTTIALSLIFGKSIGIALFSYLGIKLGLAVLPEDINFKQIIGVSFLAGIGFTMSIFVSNLAFQGNAALIDASKIGIIMGSLISGIIGFIILRIYSNSLKK
ncbi:MAG: Na+/H+ antiporter NhaA [Flavobacteriaceae bacterium]|nr:Na+/H+ antiporter NhaA [Flavobacteriaceae bacterium]